MRSPAGYSSWGCKELDTTWASLVAQLVKTLPVMQFDPWVEKIPWRRERLPTPVVWPGEFHGPYSPWGRKELDMTERLSLFTIRLNKNNMQITETYTKIYQKYTY